MRQVPQAEAANKRPEQRFAPRDSELANDREAIRKLEEELRRDGNVMAANRRAELERDIRDRSREFKRASEDFKEDLNIVRNEGLGKLQRQIIQAIAEIAEKEQYDQVLTDNVIFARKRVDFTETVLGRLKEIFQGGGQ